MEKQKALDILDKVSGKTIGHIYDTNNDVQEAILLLYPDFEYPDWSHKYIFQFIHFVSHYFPEK